MSSNTLENGCGIQKTHWWCNRLLVLWECVRTSCRSAGSPVSRLSIALCPLERSACAPHNCNPLFPWLLTMGCEKISNFFSFCKERSHMALVLVMFPGLLQPKLNEVSRVNITICKGIQTHIYNIWIQHISLSMTFLCLCHTGTKWSWSICRCFKYLLCCHSAFRTSKIRKK